MVTTRAIEVAVPVGFGVFGAVIVLGSLGHQIGWGDSGPGAGYFPFRLGLIIIALAIVLAIKAWRKADNRGPFLSHDAFRRVGALTVQTAVCAGAMPLLGCYVPSALFLAYVMRRLGRYSLLRALATGILVMVIFYLVFEIWFMVPLAKGPVEALLGLS